MSLFARNETGWQATAAARFDGATYEPARDGARLAGQLQRVYAAMSDGQWWTLDALVERCGGTTASASARTRDLRKAKFGGHVVERRHVGGGLFEYRLVKEATR